MIVKVSLRATDFSFGTQDGYYDLSIPVSLLPTGTYFLRLETRNKARTEKIIKGGE
ncbi:MAG: T9SS type A sorting domain-containing protein [candidate division WOR-3 bacterium]